MDNGKWFNGYPQENGPEYPPPGGPERHNGGPGMGCAECDERGRGPSGPFPPPVPPVRYVPGMNVQEQLANMAERVNTAINRWNQIQRNCYETLENMVGAAVNNNVYYSPDEVALMDGYSAEDSCAYSIVEARAVDRSGKPIFCNLRPAYNQVVNSGARELITDVSFVASGQAVITAFQASETRWKGTTLFMSGPGEAAPDSTVWVAGWTRSGVLKFFPGDVDLQTLRQNRMVSCIGPIFPILDGGNLYSEVLDSMGTAKGSIQAMGWKNFNGNKVFLSCSMYDQPGMTPQSVAKVLQNMGCTTAVITSYQTEAVSSYTAVPADAGTTEANVNGLTGGMTYLGKLTTAPVNWDIPMNGANWVISKRPPRGWENAFTAQIAATVQKLGNTENQLNSTIGGIQDNTTELLKLENQIAQVEQQVSSLDGQTQQFDGRVTALEEKANQLDGKIDQVEQTLTAQIQSVQELANKANTTAEQALQNAADNAQAIQQETKERESAISAVNANVAAQVSALQSKDVQLQNAINTETSNRTSADAELTAAINSEATARASADQALQSSISVETTNRQSADTSLQTQITALKQESEASDSALKQTVESLQDGTGLPLATVNTPGVIKVGNNLTISADGTLNAQAGGEGGGEVKAGPGIIVTKNTSTGAYTVGIDENVVVNEDQLSTTNAAVAALQSAVSDQGTKDQAQDEEIGENKTGIAANAAAIAKNTTDIENVTSQLSGVSDDIAAIKSGADLPIASADTLGAIKVGANLSISEDGTLSASSGEGQGGETVAQGTGITVEHDTETNVATVGLTAEVQGQLASIADKATNADLTALQTTVAGKANTSDLNAVKATADKNEQDITALTTEVEGVKVTANDAASGVSTLTSSVVTLGNKVEALESGATTTGTDIADIKSDISGINTTLVSQSGEIQTASNAAQAAQATADGKVSKTGDSMTGQLNVPSVGLVSGSNTRLIKVTATGISVGMPNASGGEDAIPVAGMSDPVQPTDGANKQYVDNAVASVQAVAGQASEAANSANQLATAASGTANEAKTAAENAMPKSGGTFTGKITSAPAGIALQDEAFPSTTDINVYNSSGSLLLTRSGASGVRISGLLDPVNNNQAATKQYVDEKSGSVIKRIGSGSLSNSTFATLTFTETPNNSGIYMITAYGSMTSDSVASGIVRMCYLFKGATGDFAVGYHYYSTALPWLQVTLTGLTGSSPKCIFSFTDAKTHNLSVTATIEIYKIIV